MDNYKYYTIRVGIHKPEAVEIGNLNKTSGLPDGPTEKAESVVGVITIPGYSKIWAKRELDAEGKATGRFTPMEWGKEGGEVVEIRYMRNSSSLDKQFQELKKIQFSDQDAEIRLFYGINKIDPIKDRNLVAFLKLHTYNGDNKSRDPANRNIIFREYDPKKEVDAQKRAHQHLTKAMAFVDTVGDDPKRLRVMAIAFGFDEHIADGELIYMIMKQAASDPGAFLEQRDKFRDNAQGILFRCYDLGIIDVDTPKELTIKETGDTLMAGFAKLEGTKKLAFVVDNVFEPDCFEVVQRASQLLALKESQVS